MAWAFRRRAVFFIHSFFSFFNLLLFLLLLLFIFWCVRSLPVHRGIIILNITHRFIIPDVLHTHTHRERWTLGFIFPPFFHPLLSTLGVVVTYDLPSQLSSHRSSLIYADCFYDGKEGVIFLDFKSSREEGKKTRRTTQREIPLSLSAHHQKSSPCLVENLHLRLLVLSC